MIKTIGKTSNVHSGAIGKDFESKSKFANIPRNKQQILLKNKHLGKYIETDTEHKITFGDKKSKYRTTYIIQKN